jgi:cysteine desulfuration protein SufE|tara:strand:- start:193 stop:630 length:438 start_codon:yes stop_codon:yes gene_type:complete
VSRLLDLEKYDEFVGNLELIDDEDMRFEYIIDVGKKAGDADFPEVMKVDANLMHGCMSKVWIIDRVDDGRHYFSGFSDAIIVKGLVTMMTESFSGLTGDELDALNEDHVRKLNLGALTTQRQVGMLAMLAHLQKLGRRVTTAAAD